MDSVYLDRVTSDDERRAQLFRGQIFVYSPTPGSTAFVQLARDMIKRAFGSLEPETAQFRMPVEEYVAVLSALKPEFIHDPRSKECIQVILRDLKCDPEKTYFDLPRLRTATSDDYLTTGMAYVQVWRPIRHPVESFPLAMCDARSMEFADFIISERRYPNRVGQTYAVTFNPAHRWYWLPRMRRDEALVFKVFDSMKDGRARWSAHTAFEDPTSPPHARPRESIEIRTLAFF